MPKAKKNNQTTPTPPPLVEVIRDRIIEFRRIPARELLKHDGNWRTHPGIQRDAMVGILREVGIADALLAYYSEREGGALTLIDGHLRKDIDPDLEWPCLILDVQDDEADKILATHDPLAALAGANSQDLTALMQRVTLDDLALREMMRQVQMAAAGGDIDDAAGEADQSTQSAGGPAEMALQPFEHYDYLVLFFRTTFDFERALDLLGVERVGYTARTNKTWDDAKRKVGLGRVLDGVKVLEMLAQTQPQNKTGEQS